jgi:hypothetical protein
MRIPEETEETYSLGSGSGTLVLRSVRGTLDSGSKTLVFRSERGTLELWDPVLSLTTTSSRNLVT